MKTFSNGIIITVGPTMESELHFKDAIQSGALNFRFQLAHRNRDHISDMWRLRKVAYSLNKSVSVIFDIPSNRPRTGDMKDRKLKIGEKLYFKNQKISEDADIIPLPNLEVVIEFLKQGDTIAFADGKIRFQIIDIDMDMEKLTVEVERIFDQNIMIKSNMGLTIPIKDINYTILTTQDEDLFQNCLKNKNFPDWLALSYIRHPQQILDVRDTLFNDYKWSPKLMAKIETSTGLKNVREIAKISDGLMVARGDLLTAIEPEELYEAQKKIISAGKSLGKIVVTATQLLEIFSETGYYFRSELIDLANAVSQGTTTLMLSKESCFCMRKNGPVESIQLMQRIFNIYSKYNEFKKLPAVLLKPQKRPYKIIAIEGPNGVGKSTICKHLSKVFKVNSLFGVAEEFLSYKLKKRIILEADWTASVFYFICAAIELNRELKEKKLIFITDRSPWSTASQHIATDYSREDFVLSLMKSVADKLPVPDHIVILEASYETCLKRIEKKQKDEKIFDKVTKEYFIKEKHFYQRIHSQHPSSVLINTDGLNEEQIFDIVFEWVKDKMENREDVSCNIKSSKI